MKTQFLRLGWLIFLIVGLSVGVKGQSIVQLPKLTNGSYNLKSLPQGFFTATRGTQPAEINNLYFTDGTASGMVQLTQTPVGIFTNVLNTVSVIGKTLYFVQADGVYKSDGTMGGTVLIKALSFSNPSLGKNGIIYKNQLLFQDDALNIWKTDGTTAGTVIIKRNLGFQNIVLFQDKAYFSAGDNLYSTDGTEAGTQLIKTFSTGDYPNSAGIVAVSNSKFVVNNGYYTGPTTAASQLYISDGTSAGTVALTAPNTPTLRAIGYSPIDNLFYFLGGDKTIWRSDGTTSGTASTSIVYGDGVNTLMTTDGLFLYSSKIVKIINGQATDLLGSNGYSFNMIPDAASAANVFEYINGVLYFNAANQSRNNEIWRSDGTVNGTYSLSTADDKTAGRFARVVLNINNTIYLSESIQKTITIGQPNTERGQITRIDRSGDKDVRKIVLADQDVSLTSIATMANGKAFCYGFIATNVFTPAFGFYSFDPGAAPVHSCSLTATLSGNNTLPCTANATTPLTALVTDGTSPLMYQWQRNGTNISGATSASYVANAQGDYTVLVSDSKNCSATSAKLTLASPKPIVVTIIGSTTLCTGQPATLTASLTGGTAPYTYQWKQNGIVVGSNAASLSITISGTYSLLVTDACSSTTASFNVTAVACVTPTILLPSSGATATSPITMTTNTGLTGGADAGATFQWLLNGNPIAGAVSPTYTASASGSYAVVVTLNGRVTTSPVVTLTINVVLATEPLGLTENQVMVYPNSTTGECWVLVDVATRQTTTLYLTDTMGKTVRQWKVQVGPKMQPLQVTLPDADGLYFLRVETEKGAVVKKVVRSR